MKFSKGFYWGTATSAHQVEGGNRNDWTEWEIRNAKIKMQNAKLREWPDCILNPPAGGPNPLREENYISGKACDHYHRFREDFDMAKQIGLNAYRFSIEWSRVEPEEGEFSEKEIEHYREMIGSLRERGMEPFVTLWHWTLPLWVAQQGGWESPRTAFYFSRFCERVAKELSKEVRFWITMNEPSPWAAQAYLYGIFPPRKRNPFSLVRVYFNLIRAHKEVFQKLKAVNKNFQIGIAENLEWWEPAFLKLLIHYFRNFFLLGRIHRHLDFVGVNYYRRMRLFGKPEGLTSDVGWEIYPEGLYYFLKEIWRRFRKPIFITENGLADARDQNRAQFIREHIYWVGKAIEEGTDIRGYFHWSLLDNFEWERGFWPRFGLVEVNYRTQERRVRDSVRVYAEIIRESN